MKTNLKLSILLDNIYSIIDSKIQYIIYELNTEIMRAHDTEKILRKPQRSPQLDAHGIIMIPDDFCPAKKRKILQRIEKSTTVINRLLTLRTKLNAQNIEMIYNLVSDNYYLEFDNRELKLIIDGKSASREY